MKALSHSVVSIDKQQDLKSLRQLVKQETGLAVRRMDAFTLIGLLAVYRAEHNLDLVGRCGLYSCADYFSSELMQSLMLDMSNNKPVKPLDFVASVGNAANFYIAKAFSIEHANIFLGSSEQAMMKAEFLATADLNLKTIDNAYIVIWQEDENVRRCEVKII